MPIDSHLTYLDKNTFVPLNSGGYRIEAPPHPDLGLVVVIPCYDEPDLIGSLRALLDCEPADCAVEVITVVNSGIQDPAEILEQNAKTLREAVAWAQSNAGERLAFHFLHFPALPRKHAGVGLARKIGMDMAAWRLEQVGREESPIACFDADSRCSPNYLRALESHFRDRPAAGYCSIYFEHPLEGDLPEPVYQGILRYELYLRYYVNGLRYAGSPYGHHTVGSSMAVRSRLYQSQGGMNRRKAGEDFYFLNKLPRGEKSVLNKATVIPSPRPSNRVPFGTGKAIGAWLESPDEAYPVYDPRAFVLWKAAVNGVEGWFDKDESAIQAVQQGFSPPLRSYMESIDFVEQVMECRKYTTTPAAFVQRYHHWLNGLRTLQFFHYVRDHHLPDQPIAASAWNLLRLLRPGDQVSMFQPNLKGLLRDYRVLDLMDA